MGTPCEPPLVMPSNSIQYLVIVRFWGNMSLKNLGQQYSDITPSAWKYFQTSSFHKFRNLVGLIFSNIVNCCHLMSDFKNCTKLDIFWGSAPEPASVTKSTPQTLSWIWDGQFLRGWGWNPKYATEQRLDALCMLDNVNSYHDITSLLIVEMQHRMSKPHCGKPQSTQWRQLHL